MSGPLFGLEGLSEPSAAAESRGEARKGWVRCPVWLNGSWNERVYYRLFGELLVLADSESRVWLGSAAFHFRMMCCSRREHCHPASDPHRSSVFGQERHCPAKSKLTDVRDWQRLQIHACGKRDG